MIQDSLLEFNQQWEALANAGIGGPTPYVAPTVYTATPATAANAALTVTISGSSYTDMMAATHRPLMPVFAPNEIYYSFAFDITPDDNQANIQVIEFEASYCDTSQYYYNNSMQLNYVNPKNQIQAYTPATVWADTGIIVEPFTPEDTTSVVVNYLVDTINHNMSTLSVEIAGEVYPMPSQFQKISGAVRSGWASGVYVQFQHGLAYAAPGKIISFTNKYSNIAVNWL